MQDKVLLISIVWFLSGIGSIYMLTYFEEPVNMPYFTFDMYSYFDDYSNSYKSDSTVKAISSFCRSSNNPVLCVFNQVPMYVDFSRIDNPVNDFVMPSDYYIFGGVCRDVTLIRHSALSNLGINCLFDFSEPNHVFLVCIDNDKIYILNNSEYLEKGYE